MLHPPDNEATPPKVRLCVLASGSGGNCAVLAFGDGPKARLVLIDAGLSPRQTALRLADLGFHLRQITDVLLTHLDRDHCAPAWSQALLQRATLRMHKRHMPRARRQHMLYNTRTELFADEPFRVPNVGNVHALMMDHDQLGVAVFRIQIGDHSLGYATDLGCVRDDLIEHLRGVDTLAIESNYDPAMQHASSRPMFLKRRIMGGAGHLSNEECAKAVQGIEPKKDVVLLHLSRQCNTPALASVPHAGAEYNLTVSLQHKRTEWIKLGNAEPLVAQVQTKKQMGLFAG